MKKIWALALSAIVSAVAPAVAQDSWQPTRNIEFIVPFSAGGGSDINARSLLEAIRQNNLVQRNMLIVHRPGGSGAIGGSYVVSRRGDPHTMMNFSSGQVMGGVANNTPVRVENLTPLGILAVDTALIVTRTDSNYDSFDELIEAARSNPQTVTVGGQGRGTEDDVGFRIVNRHADDGLQYVPFDGSADILAALLGGHLDAAVFKPNAVILQSMEAGTLTGLGMLSEERLDGAFADVPTLRELGYENAVWEMYRGYAGPADMPAEAVAYWDNVFAQVAESEEWARDIEHNNLIPVYHNAEESRAIFLQEEERLTDLLTEFGLLN